MTTDATGRDPGAEGPGRAAGSRRTPDACYGEAP